MSSSQKHVADSDEKLDTRNLTVVPLRHPFRLACVLLVVVLLGALVRALVINPEFQWPTVARYLFAPTILHGLYMTIMLTVVIMTISSVLGTIIALMMRSSTRLLSVPATAFVWFFRGTPALVQLILWYNMSLVFKTVTLWIPGIGVIFSIPTNDLMTPITAAIIALSLQEAGYMAEIVRSGLKAVNRGQTEAAACLGMKPSLLLRRIVLPQAMRVIVPPTANEAINLLKTTSLVSTIAVADVLYSAQAIYARTFETIPLLLVVTFWYLAVVSLLSVGQFYLERYFARDQVRQVKRLSRVVTDNIGSFRRKESLV